MSATATTSAWDALHRQARHRLEYPSEHVVRFLAGLELDMPARALDIGCGSGRHAILLDAFGFDTYACDLSADAVSATKKRWGGSVKQAPMTSLPFVDEMFNVALAYNVFYYGTADETLKAVAELHRVLRPGGRAFVVVRSDDDWRNEYVDDHGVFNCDGEPEDGMPLTFVPERLLPGVYSAFEDVAYERSDTTTGDRARVNSDWLVSVTK